ncbi:hypothetical protein DLH94_11095 [Vibrio parahaemolyticus]|nr:hypothetical protein [Vibrio parahaemolyticus]
MYSIDLLREQLPELEETTEKILVLIDQRDYEQAFKLSTEYKSQILSLKQTLDDSQKNHAYILDVFFNMLGSISLVWKEIESSNYLDSWWKLQDSLDDLRCLRKFYTLESKTLGFFEDQLQSIESIYPYEYFSSPGFIVEKYICTICKNDIESDDCDHLKGQLYSGEMALAEAKILDIDHFAMVENPMNKRLAIGTDSHPRFNVFKHIVKSFENKESSPLDFSDVNLIEVKGVKNSSKKLPRNSLCSCGSKKKYKKCCLLKETSSHIVIDLKGTSIFPAIF